jgi:hypothetical protein
MIGFQSQSGPCIPLGYVGFWPFASVSQFGASPLLVEADMTAGTG